MGGPSQFVKFKERLHTLRVQHAVTQCGQQIMVFVLTNLFNGAKSDLKQSVLVNVGSNTQYNKNFTSLEQEKLEDGDYKTWSITLLYKILQISCGLQYPSDSRNQMQYSNGGEDTLENQIHLLKEWQREITTNFNLIMSKEEMYESLENLRVISSKILVALSDKVQINESDVKTISQLIAYIIEDVKQAVNETNTKM